ncbi:hypothetical protein [Deinococcus soli (ex Cha et al. 2016)]|uniref:hypothetical protein n=1 Tax=Deinococcus soli (ex Cha et al. 2016) TaxID=1309411 RepID=UPI00166BEA62|nr:hypothetical protein [Deinococcus soli (ex Cha et al. 2016)]GGB79209.1 hypothetical protein GCM10008019_39300 [Deinococcus soli (ex Cha et al. 2016)]
MPVQDDLHGFPVFSVSFDRSGAPVHLEDAAALTSFLHTRNLSDLMVFVHGWNNNMDEARRWYGELLDLARQELQRTTSGSLTGRSLGALFVYWPSKRFTDPDLIPGGAASTENAVFRDEVQTQLAVLAKDEDDTRQAAAAEMQSLLPQLGLKASARQRFVELARTLGSQEGADAQDEDSLPELFSGPAEDVFSALQAPIAPPSQAASEGGVARVGILGPQGAEGGAAGLQGFFGGGVLNAARNLLNLTTYYLMKDRAGIVGRQGLSPLLHEIRSVRPDLKLHLIGHSFGARLVTAATQELVDEPQAHPNTLILLQAAFSHYGLATDYRRLGQNGAFQPVVARPAVRGPVVITHSHKDTAVGLAYPAASLLARQVAASFGDAGDLYGGMGRNGAQDTPQATQGTLLDPSGVYTFAPGRVHNLEASAFIGGHSDIRNAAVAHAILAAITSASP